MSSAGVELDYIIIIIIYFKCSGTKIHPGYKTRNPLCCALYKHIEQTKEAGNQRHREVK